MNRPPSSISLKFSRLFRQWATPSYRGVTSAMGQPEKGSRRAYVFRNATDSCRMRVYCFGVFSLSAAVSASITSTTMWSGAFGRRVSRRPRASISSTLRLGRRCGSGRALYLPERRGGPRISTPKEKGGSEAAPSSTSWCFRCSALHCQAKPNLAQPNQTAPNQI